LYEIPNFLAISVIVKPCIFYNMILVSKIVNIVTVKLLYSHKAESEKIFAFFENIFLNLLTYCN
jgi:hypothetical protein